MGFVLRQTIKYSQKKGGVMQLIDLTGKRFGYLTVIKRDGAKGKVGSKVKHVTWLCSCDCGKTIVTRGAELRRGGTKSCGCYRRAWSKKKNTTHGKFGTPVYRSWQSMVARCNNPSTGCYHNYGGRGITVCSRWLSFENFFADMGEKPKNRTLDRIDNEGNYEPGNCRWANHEEQATNQRRVKLIETSQGKLSMTQIAKIAGVTQCAIKYRLRSGLRGDELLAQKNSFLRKNPCMTF